MRGDENLCPYSRYTGWDADGGYAEYAVVDENFAYPIPDRYDDEHAAPLLCAGIVGYRALRRARVAPGGRLGIYGFGASAHLAAQVALAEGTTVHVLTRAEQARKLALSLGAASAGGAYDMPPEPLDGAVLFAPVGDLVPVALAALDRGGTLSIAGIHLSDIPVLELPAAPVPGADADQHHVQHPRGRAGVPGIRRPARPGGRRRSATRSTAPATRWPTSPPTGSPGRPS